MSSRTRRRVSAQKKAQIVRRHLGDKVAVGCNPIMWLTFINHKCLLNKELRSSTIVRFRKLQFQSTLGRQRRCSAPQIPLENRVGGCPSTVLVTTFWDCTLPFCDQTVITFTAFSGVVSTKVDVSAV